MYQLPSFTLVNSQTGNLAFKLFSFEDHQQFTELQRLNYYSLIWIKKGEGSISADFSIHPFKEDYLFAFSPYQPFMLKPEIAIEGLAIHFHPDFFCIHKHQEEVACNGVLFNNIYNPPFVVLTSAVKQTFEIILGQITNEMQQADLAQHELLVSYLKIVLITASRLKSQQQPVAQESLTENKEPFILQNLKQFIEQHFKTKHAPSEYADLLAISPKALAKLTKGHFKKTLSDLISERIVIEAKRELYLTNKTVKQIAFELGYDDEHYFSRFFKNHASISPQVYRDTVGVARGELYN